MQRVGCYQTTDGELFRLDQAEEAAKHQRRLDISKAVGELSAEEILSNQTAADIEMYWDKIAEKVKRVDASYTNALAMAQQVQQKKAIK